AEAIPIASSAVARAKSRVRDQGQHQLQRRAHLPRAGTALLRQDPNRREQRGTLVLHRARSRRCWLAKSEGLSGGCPHLARRLSSPPLECVREAIHLLKTEQPRNLEYIYLAVIKVTNRQIAPQLLKYFGEVQPFVRKLSGQRPLAHSQIASNVFHEYSSMREQRRDCILNFGAQ